MTFGEKLVYLRERHGMSQEELAEKLDVSRQTISNWENDKVKIDVDKAIEICQLLTWTSTACFCRRMQAN